MFYVVQENTFKERNYDMLIHNLDRLGLEYDIVKSLAFTDNIMKGDMPNNIEINENSEYVYHTDRKDVFVFGSLKLARCAKQHDWFPGSLSNKNHDYDVYKNFWKKNLLNYDSEIVRFNDIFKWDTEYKFIRPCEDTKTFTGKVFDYDEWKQFVQYSLDNGHTTQLCSDTRIQVSSIKEIYKEIRCWVVGGKVVTASQYRLGNNTILSSDVENSAYEFAQSMVDVFKLADCFVIDVCLTDNGWKIVEAGCINCAGFYEADLNKVLMALEDYYTDENTEFRKTNPTLDWDGGIF